MNKSVLIGRLVKDPDLKFTEGKGTAISNFTLAVKRPKVKDTTDFINCVAYGKQAETIAQYIVKGNLLACDGYIRTGQYIGRDGVKRYTSDVVVTGFEFLGKTNTVDKDLELIENGGCPF